MRPRVAQIHNSGATAGQGIVSDGTAWTLVDVATQAELGAHAAAADPHVGYVQEALLDAKGDLFVGTAADTVARLAVGANGQVLIADSAQAVGVKWAAVVASQLSTAWVPLQTTVGGVPELVWDANNELVLVEVPVP